MYKIVAIIYFQQGGIIFAGFKYFHRGRKYLNQGINISTMVGLTRHIITEVSTFSCLKGLTWMHFFVNIQLNLGIGPRSMCGSAVFQGGNFSWT